MGKERMEQGFGATVNNPNERASQMLAGDNEFARQESDEKAKFALEKEKEAKVKAAERIRKLEDELAILDRELADAEGKLRATDVAITTGAERAKGHPTLEALQESLRQAHTKERVIQYDEVERLKQAKEDAKFALEFERQRQTGKSTDRSQ